MMVVIHSFSRFSLYDKDEGELFALQYNTNNYNKNKTISKKEEEDEQGEDGTAQQALLTYHSEKRTRTRDDDTIYRLFLATKTLSFTIIMHHHHLPSSYI